MEKEFTMRRRYSEAFKRQVIEEYLATGCSQKSLLRKYEIAAKGVFLQWMRQLGYCDQPADSTKKFTFKEPTFYAMPCQSSSLNTSEAAALQQKIAELQRALQDERLRSQAYLLMLEKAEKELRFPIRKKFSTK